MDFLLSILYARHKCCLFLGGLYLEFTRSEKDIVILLFIYLFIYIFIEYIFAEYLLRAPNDSK